MANPKIRVVLQGNAKYRDGKKWKKRYCLLSVSPKNHDALHLYMTKSYDDFTVYRNENCIVDYQIPLSDRNFDCSNYLKLNGPCYTGFPRESTCGAGDVVSDTCVHPEKSVQTLVNTATQSCLAAADATEFGLSTAISLAARLNAPPPVDEISGFESGYHMDKESNIVVLLGTRSVYIIALQGTDEMFRWAEAMSQIMTDSRFRVTLRKSTEGSKLSQGLQGSLHVQRWRLCLIGEPSAGCKFICSWRLDSVLKAYTQLSPAATSSSGDIITRKQTVGEGASHRISFGSVSLLGNSSGWPHQLAPLTKPKSLFILEADQSSGKGRGTHVFELDGGSLNELIKAIELFMSRRYASIETVNRLLRSSQEQQESHLSSDLSEKPKCSFPRYSQTPLSLSTSQHQPIVQHAASPAQTVPAPRQAGGTFASRSSPLPVPINQSWLRSSDTMSDHSMCGLSVPALPSNRFSCPARHYSNLILTTSSLSSGDPMFDAVNRSTSISTGNIDLDGNASVGSHQSVNAGFVHRPVGGIENAGHVLCSIPASWDGGAHHQSSISATVANFPYSRLSVERTSEGSYCPYPATSEAVLHTVDEPQVARVAAGLVISKWVSGTPSSVKQIPSLAVTSHCCSLLAPTEPVSSPCTGTLFVVRKPSVDVGLGQLNQSVDSKPTPHPHVPCRCTRICRRRRTSSDFGTGLPPSNGTHEPCAIGLRCQLNNVHSPNCMTQHGVFRADEDISDTEQAMNRRPSETSDSQHATSSGATTKPCPDRLHSDSYNFGELDLRHVINYRTFRRRHRQYRACFCYAYAGRSLSADMLFHLCLQNIAKSAHLRSYTIPTEGSTDRGETRPLVAIAFDCHPSPGNSNVLKTFCGTRWRNIHRLFHRKHSKSHDSLHNASNPPVKPSTCGSILSSSSAAKCSVDSDQRDSEASFIKFPLSNADALLACDEHSTPFFGQNGRQLLFHCSRHGISSYDFWLRLLRSSATEFPFCSRCRRKASNRPPINKSLCICLAPTSSSGPSVVSALRALIPVRHKSRGTFSFGKSCVRRQISAPSKEVPRISTLDPAGAMPNIRLNQCPTCSLKPHRPSLPMDQPSAPHHSRTRSQCSFDDCQRCQSVLSLTSIPCSEPAIPTTDCMRGPLPLTHSLFSSLSSLVNSHSVSDSGSVLSASHGVTKFSGKMHPSKSCFEANDVVRHEMPARTRSSSFCETDEMSSGSAGYCDDLANNERHSGTRLSYDFTKNLYVDCSPFKLSLNNDPCMQFNFHELDNRCARECEQCLVESAECQPRPIVHSKWRSGIPPLSWCKRSLSQIMQEQHLCPSHTSPLSLEHNCECIRIQNRFNDHLRPQRSSTLPSSKLVLRSDFEHHDSFAPPVSHPATSQSSGSADLLRSTCNKSSRFSRRVRRSSRYKTAVGSLVSNVCDPVNESDVSRSTGVDASQPVDHDSRINQTAYCNVKALQPTSIGVCKTSVVSFVPNDPGDCLPPDRSQASQSLYVNLPVFHTNPTNLATSGSSRHVLHAVHHPMGSSISSTKIVAVQSLSSSSLVGVLEPNSDEIICSVQSVKQYPCPTAQSSNVCSCVAPVLPCLACVSSITPKMTELPAEVRDPSRNYAMVDLRPCPASSVNANSELARGVVHYQPSHPHGSANSSAGSIVGFSNSTSTGSDCASDAATLTSDTLGSYTTGGSTTEPVAPPVTTGLSASAPDIARRRHSHSLSSAISESPGLNYVHVVTSTAPITTPHPARRGEGYAASDSAGYIIPEHTDSPSSSSGLGGIASQSITPPLAPTGSATFGDIFTSRSMTSSATSSGEGVAADPGFHSTSPIDDESVAYTQIDFTRTLALGEVQGDMEHHQENSGISTQGRSQWRPVKTDRSASVRKKTFSYPIRSMKRSNQKKPN